MLPCCLAWAVGCCRCSPLSSLHLPLFFLPFPPPSLLPLFLSMSLSLSRSLASGRPGWAGMSGGEAVAARKTRPGAVAKTLGPRGPLPPLPRPRGPPAPLRGPAGRPAMLPSETPIEFRFCTGIILWHHVVYLEEEKAYRRKEEEERIRMYINGVHSVYIAPRTHCCALHSTAPCNVVSALCFRR